MSISRLLRPALIGAGLLLAASAQAADWPEKPVTLIAPAPPT
jgi:tripartite-type tricarboxylate transporter receptor subunit TctC